MFDREFLASKGNRNRPSLHHNRLGYIHWRRMEIAKATRHFRKCVNLEPATWQYHANLAQLLLLTGDYEIGFREFEHRQFPFEPPHQPRWTGQPLNNETVVIGGEAGWGDMLMFARYAPMVAARGGRVVLAVPKPLHQLLATVDGVDAILTSPDQLPPRFYFVWMMSLPGIFGTKVDTVPASIPYLRGDPAPWATFLDDLSGIRVGLCWAGKPDTAIGGVEMDSRRSMQLADLAPILKVPGCSFVSLQLGEPAKQLRDYPAIHDVANRLNDWTDTADLIAGLDLVITVDTAVAHLAGALGKPVWLLCRSDTCWRWLTKRTDTPWYPTMRLYRQPTSGDWRIPVASIVRDLQKEIDAVNHQAKASPSVNSRNAFAKTSGPACRSVA